MSYKMFFIFISSFFVFTAYSQKSIDLGTSGAKYQSELSRLRHSPAGTSVKFGDGKTFSYIKYLGNGHLTAIFEVEDNKAVRVPLHPWTRYTNPRYIRGYKTLEKFDLPIPKTFEYYSDQYIVVEKLNLDISLLSFLSRMRGKLSDRKFLQDIKGAEGVSEEDKMLTENLVESLVQFFPFAQIDDFKEEQWAYSKKDEQWYFVDISEFNEKFDPEYHNVDDTPLNGYFSERYAEKHKFQQIQRGRKSYGLFALPDAFREFVVEKIVEKRKKSLFVINKALRM